MNDRLPLDPLPAEDALDLLVDRYLEGALSPAQTRAFEARLGEPALQAALAEGLSLRSWLGELGPEEAPAELVEALEAALGAAVEAAPTAPKSGGWAGLAGALSGLAWVTAGPTLALGASGRPLQSGGQWSAAGATLGLTQLSRAALPQREAQAPKRRRPSLSGRLARRAARLSVRLVRGGKT